MASGKKSAVISKKTSFDEVVDGACQRLMEQQVQNSIRRINEMQGYLIIMEQELDEFLAGSAAAQKTENK